jgi:tryptophan synthase beta chain
MSIADDKISARTGYFGEFGGRYVPEMLLPALEELEAVFRDAQDSVEFQAQFKELIKNFSGRPTPLTFAQNLTAEVDGAKIYLKNEGLNLTGAHKITHCIGQALLAKRLGKTRLIAETGAGQHGVATATIAAKLGFDCVIYMGEVDIERQRPNVFIMERLGATVVPVADGSKTLKDAVNAAIRDWLQNTQSSYYLLGSALGPHPYPTMVSYFQSIVGREIREQLASAEAKLPDYIVACVGGGSNAIGAFADFIDEPTVKLIGVEAGGRSTSTKGEHASRFPGGSVGVVEGYKSVFLQDKDGQLLPTHSISAGLDYPGVGPELAELQKQGRIKFTRASDAEALKAVDMLARTEGILPALESAHAVAEAIKLASSLRKAQTVVVNLSGRGDKDIFILAHAFNDEKFRSFLESEAKRYPKSP